MGPNMSKCIPHINTKQNSPKQAYKNSGIHDCTKTLSNKNIAQHSTHAKVTSPSLELCKNQTWVDHQKKRENAVIKREC